MKGRRLMDRGKIAFKIGNSSAVVESDIDDKRS